MQHTFVVLDLERAVRPCSAIWTAVYCGRPYHTPQHARVALQENASRPDNLPPSQGGKYVGFGSSPSMPARRAAQPAGVEDVTAMLSRGLSSLSVAAQVAASKAASTVQSSTQVVSKTLQEKQVAEVLSANAKVVQERAGQLAQVRRAKGRGWRVRGRTGWRFRLERRHMSQCSA